MIGTSLASASRPLWRLLEHYDIDPTFVFREAGLDPAVMNEPRGRFKVERTIAAWGKAAELIDDPCFGLKIADAWSPTDVHALGYAFLASSTLRTALRRLARYVAVVNDRVGFTVEEDGEHVSVTHQTLDPDLSFSLAVEDARWALIASMCRQSYGDKLDLVEVRLQHPEPPCKGAYNGFFRCPVRFDSPKSAILFARADLDYPLPVANRELARASDGILCGFLANLTDGDLITRVKLAIVDALPSGQSGDDDIAKAVYTTRRTLQRRLAALGTTYSKVLDSVRRELAEQYLADPERSMREISFLLGFSELSAFSRAFKRWTGKAPSEMREAVAA